MHLRTSWLVLVAAGCAFSPPEGTLHCDPLQACPPSFVCRADSRCWRSALDGGPVDASTPDAPMAADLGALDAGSPDAASVDAASVDAASVDAASVDSSITDSNS